MNIDQQTARPITPPPFGRLRGECDGCGAPESALSIAGALPSFYCPACTQKNALWGAAWAGHPDVLRCVDEMMQQIATDAARDFLARPDAASSATLSES